MKTIDELKKSNDKMIQAKELMIGDIVKAKNGNYYHRVGLVFYDAIRIEIAHEIMDISIDKFEPVPLTETVLEANGFHKVHHAGTGATEEYDDYITNGFLCCHMTEDWKDTYFCLPDTPIRFNYVHELQRVLRCCGKWELADNLKLE